MHWTRRRPVAEHSIYRSALLFDDKHDGNWLMHKNKTCICETVCGIPNTPAVASDILEISKVTVRGREDRLETTSYLKAPHSAALPVSLLPGLIAATIVDEAHSFLLLAAAPR